MSDEMGSETKKTFFLFADKQTEKWLGDRISEQEYEAFFLQNHQKVRDVLEHYTDSILFINTSGAVRNFNLFDFVNSLKANIVSPNLAVGIIGAGGCSDEGIESCIDFNVEIANEKNSLRCDQTLTRILGVLADYQARGRRRYIRVKCSSHYHATFSVKKEGKILNGYINDISSAGMMACFSEPCHWERETTFHDLQLRLFGTNCSLSGRVMGSHGGDRQNWVILFDYSNSPCEKQKIQAFISQMLRREFQEKLEDLGNRHLDDSR